MSAFCYITIIHQSQANRTIEIFDKQFGLRSEERKANTGILSGE